MQAEIAGPGNRGNAARAEILNAARGLFLERGFGATSMRDIASASGGRAVAGIYNHFPNKQAIFQALMEADNPYPQILEALESGQGDTAPDFVASVLRRVVPLMIEHVDFIALVQIDARELKGENLARLLQHIGLPRFLEVVQRIKMLPGLKDHDPAVLIRLFASTVIGYIITRRVAPVPLIETLSDDAWFELYLDTLLYGLVPRQ